jgi:hypothetical protein
MIAPGVNGFQEDMNETYAYDPEHIDCPREPVGVALLRLPWTIVWARACDP